VMNFAQPTGRYARTMQAMSAGTTVPHLAWSNDIAGVALHIPRSAQDGVQRCEYSQTLILSRFLTRHR